MLSGGQDSTTCLFWAVQKYRRANVIAVSYDYNQRHIREIESAYKVADMANVVHHINKIGPILISQSPLTNRGEELETYPDFATMDKVIGDRVERTFVPMRNALFLTLAANVAAVLGFDNIVTGVCQADNANYPDCRRTFLYRQEDMINEALGYNDRHSGDRYIRIDAPLMDMTKAQSIRMALATPGAWDALAWTHTAYDGVYPPVGRDHASVLRAHGFEEAKLPDPLVLRAVSEGLMPMPETPNYSEWARRVAREAAVPYNQ